jgi:hypothetical protein
MPFRGDRVVRTFSHKTPAPPERVFPLLCPVREYDWIPGWQCEIAFPETGLAELDAVFTTEVTDRGQEIWQVSRYEPPGLIEFAVAAPQSHTTRLAIEVKPTEGGSRLTWTRVYTGLTPAGNELLAGFTDEWHDALMSGIAAMMDAYLTAG